MIKKFHKILKIHIKDSVYAANDGVVTTFAVVAGFVGAKHTADIETALIVLLVIGFASLFADGFSMAIGNYLGTRSESDQYKHEKEKLKKEFTKDSTITHNEAEQFLKNKGFSDNEAKQVSTILVGNKSFFYDLIIYDRLGISHSNIKDAIRGSVVTLFSFLIAGFIPLIPYVVLSSSGSLQNHFLIACILTGCALFVIGALRTTYSDKTWINGGLEMLLVGGIAAVIAYLAGYITSLVV